MSHPLENAALLLVDIQADFLLGGALACHQADRILPGVKQLVDKYANHTHTTIHNTLEPNALEQKQNSLEQHSTEQNQVTTRQKQLNQQTSLARFNCMVATQDWHPAGHISFASSHPGRNPFELIALYDQEQTLWPDHCVSGTHGASFSEEINWDAMNLIIRKGSNPRVDSYSAFRENFGPDGQRPSTGLSGYLRERGVQNVYIAGLAPDFCVLWSAQDAQHLGFQAHIIWDLCAPVSPDSDADIRQRCETLGIGIVYSSEL